MNRKFIAWGCRNINSTHSFIHYAYKKAFESLGWDSYWFDDSDNLENFDFSNSLFLTIGGYENRIPIRKDCKYILHNCNMSKYSEIDSLILQVYTHDILSRDIEKIDNCIFYQKDINTLYQPWATDLLPSEIKLLDKVSFTDNKVVNWIGSVWGTEHGNINEISELRTSLESRGLKFSNPRHIDYDKNKIYINSSYISPAIQGKWQVDKGYIPCRIFKNISYGEFGITNSETVYNLLNNSIVFDNNIDKMVNKALEYRDKVTLDELNSQIKLIIDRHTYINRIENILKLI